MINPSLGIGCNGDLDIPSGHLITFCLSREGKQEIRPMCEWDGYVCAKWRKFLRNKKRKEKDIKSFAWLSKKCEELKTYNVGDFNTTKCCLITFTVIYGILVSKGDGWHKV